MAKKGKPEFKPSNSQRSNVSQILQMAAPMSAAEGPPPQPPPLFESRGAVHEPAQERPGDVGAANEKSRPVIDSRRKKLAHLKTLLEYREKKEINGLLFKLSNEIGHTIHFSIFNRGLLQVALEQEQELLLAAQANAGLARPSNCEIEALRHYERQIGQMIFTAFGLSRRRE